MKIIKIRKLWFLLAILASFLGSMKTTIRAVSQQGTRRHIMKYSLTLVLTVSAFLLVSQVLYAQVELEDTNTEVGEDALENNTTGIENTAIGFEALTSNTTGRQNTAVGFEALRLNNANSNTAVGFEALESNITGGQNTALGRRAMRLNTTGRMNTAVGFDALRRNTTGSTNTAVGHGALRENTTGDSNTAVGRNALRKDTVGFDNTAVGRGALRDNNGNGNTAVGRLALRFLLTGDGNTAIGFRAGRNATGSSSNNIYVDNEGVVADSNTIRIGDSQTRAFIAGINGADVGATGMTVFVNDSGQLGIVASSRRFKEDIRDMAEASSGLLQLRPVTFRYKKEYANGSRPQQYGLIAEEVAEVYPDLVTHSPGGEVEAVQYRKVNAMLLNEVQKLHRQLQAHQEQIADLSAQVARLAALEAKRRSVTAKMR